MTDLDTVTVATMRRVAEVLGLDPEVEFASGNISRSSAGDVTLSASILDRLLAQATTPDGGTSITEEEVPEVLGALSIASSVHATCGNQVQSANYASVYSAIGNRVGA